MATKDAIGRIESDGTQRIKKYSELIAENLGIELPELPTDRNPDYQQAVRLEMMGNWLESIARALDLVTDEPEPQPIEDENEPTEGGNSKYSKMDAEALALETAVHGLEKPVNITTNAEWAAWLEEQDALNEAEEPNKDDEPNEPTPSQIKRMNVADLTAYARAHGVEPEPNDTKSQVLAKLGIE